MTPDIPNAASVALIRDGEVLLIKRARAPFQHLWTLPGGRVEPGETAIDCARREIGEEIGLTLGAIKPVIQLVLAEGRYRLQVYVTTEFDGSIIASDEIEDFAWTRHAAVAGLPTTPDLDIVLNRAFAIATGDVEAASATGYGK